MKKNSIEIIGQIVIFLMIISGIAYVGLWMILPNNVTEKEIVGNVVIENEIMKDIHFNYNVISIDTEKNKEPIYHLDFEMINGNLKFQKRLSQSDYIQYLGGEDFNTITTDIYYMSIDYPSKKIWRLDYSYIFVYWNKEYYRYSFLQETDFTESAIDKIINDYIVD